MPFSVTQSRHGVHVTFTRSEGIAAANSPTSADNRRQEDTRAVVLRYARSHDGITTAAATELLGEKDYTVRRLLNAMVEEGFSRRLAGARGASTRLSDTLFNSVVRKTVKKNEQVDNPITKLLNSFQSPSF